mmetsp:Transcript_90865/g.257394  ORF Transcript_90865/g.257394 Transcript_90865/m.257394 type:complete len:376 (-) Transcript_90865:69-1196(-)
MSPSNDAKSAEPREPESSDYQKIATDSNGLLAASSGWHVDWVLQVAASLVSWWLSAIVVVIITKSTVGPGGIYPYACAFTSFTQPTIGLLAWVVSCALQRPEGAVPPLTPWEHAKLLVIGLLWGAELSLTNKALQYLAVATRTMINATNVLFMMASARVWGLERLDCLRLCSGGVLTAGGLLQGMDKQGSGMDSHMMGIAMQLASILCAAQRWALTQMVLQHSPSDSALGSMSKMQILARVIPITGLVAFLLALACEPHAYALQNLQQVELWANILLVSVACTVMQYSEWKLVQMLSFVAFNVLGTVHQIPIVLAGVLLQHDTVGWYSALGFGFCVIGALVYAAARRADMEKWAAPVAPGGGGDGDAMADSGHPI